MICARRFRTLRAFSLILSEDYAHQLDPEGLDYVQRLRASSQHMGDIIDALLALSNMMRKEVVVERLDLTALANAWAAILNKKIRNGAVDWVIAEGLTAEGDAQLLRVALENCSATRGNSRPIARARGLNSGRCFKPTAPGSFSCAMTARAFDMARAGQFVQTFKRLHDQCEFHGTGIGLVTVQRVLRRHGGKIWAEGSVNRGATFCFTLTGEAGESNGHEYHRALAN